MREIGVVTLCYNKSSLRSASDQSIAELGTILTTLPALMDPNSRPGGDGYYPSQKC